MSMMNIAKDFIKFPVTDADVTTFCGEFYTRFGFPNTVGAVDRTHIELRCPGVGDYFVFLNQKGKFFINVQMVI